ncbi:hypothetical protein H4W80_008358 [Nonomuraea angiospora]|uniref:Uncharacterized protein n=1 Tax=Nonomuraea angiospora TaxID=46172 RepID=A0ABR9MBT9_9ACTN|nr:hypothetical protein [Nonomuraea angiospora]
MSWGHRLRLQRSSLPGLGHPEKSPRRREGAASDEVSRGCRNTWRSVPTVGARAWHPLPCRDTSARCQPSRTTCVDGGRSRAWNRAPDPRPAQVPHVYAHRRHGVIAGWPVGRLQAERPGLRSRVRAWDRDNVVRDEARPYCHRDVLGVEGEPHGGVMQSLGPPGWVSARGQRRSSRAGSTGLSHPDIPAGPCRAAPLPDSNSRAARISEVRIYRVLFLHFDFIAETQVCRGDTELHHVRQRMSMSLWVQGPRLYARRVHRHDSRLRELRLR